jgi:hypothetical protein
MTPHAFDFSPLDVGLVPEFDEIRDKIDAHPGDRDFPVQMLLFFHYLGMHGNNVLMAKEAFLDFRKPGMLGAFDIGVAEAAVYLFYPGMDAMTEVDRLARPYFRRREHEIKIEQRSQEQKGHQEPTFPPGRKPVSVFAAFSHDSSIGSSRFLSPFRDYPVLVPKSPLPPFKKGGSDSTGSLIAPPFLKGGRGDFEGNLVQIASTIGRRSPI